MTKFSFTFKPFVLINFYFKFNNIYISNLMYQLYVWFEFYKLNICKDKELDYL